jgi:cell wall-associated NlpC family hydrolase
VFARARQLTSQAQNTKRKPVPEPYLPNDVRDRASTPSPLTRSPRDLADVALWETSARRSLQRRWEPRARAAGRSGVAATVAVGVAVVASVTVSPAVSEAHRSIRSTEGSASQRALGIQAGGSTHASRATRSVTASASWVADVQRRLGVTADGVYGRQTRRAVAAFQTARDLTPDGVVGPATRAALGIASAPSTVQGQTAPAPAPAASGSGAVAAARAQVGKPYAYGGNGPAAFDCSGLTTHAFRAAGISLPRTSFGQYGMGTPVSRNAIQAGDLVFFDSNGPGASHVGVATGPNSFVSATSHGVMETRIDSAYWSQHYVGARRLS